MKNLGLDAWLPIREFESQPLEHEARRLSSVCVLSTISAVHCLSTTNYILQQINAKTNES
jgi:hypothetical protein